MNPLLIIWFIFCFFYGSRVSDYFSLSKSKTKERTIFFIALTIIFVIGMIAVYSNT